MTDDSLLGDGNEKRVRGQGRGRLFFALDRTVWQDLWTLNTANRLHFVVAYLVLLAGTGSDHALTKWSAKAIEQYVGIGKPRGQRAIQELVDHGLVHRTDQSTRLAPQYRLKGLDREADPIFLPVQLITGYGSEVPVLRRIRETGDALALRMLVDLYARIEIDATYGLALGTLSLRPAADTPARRLFEMGANIVWALDEPKVPGVKLEWATYHRTESKQEWAVFWERLALLKTIGALYYETWLFDGDATDSEPLIPVDFEALDYSGTSDVAELTQLAHETVEVMANDMTYHLERGYGSYLVPFPTHHRAPAIFGVAKLRIEADTPGRRLAYGLRKQRIADYAAAFERLKADAAAGRYDRPLRVTDSEILPKR